MSFELWHGYCVIDKLLPRLDPIRRSSPAPPSRPNKVTPGLHMEPRQAAFSFFFVEKSIPAVESPFKPKQLPFMDNLHYQVLDRLTCCSVFVLILILSPTETSPHTRPPPCFLSRTESAL